MDSNCELIYGRNPVREALKAHRIKTVYVSQSFSDAKLINDLKKEKIEIIYKTNNELNKMANNGVHQGIVASVRRYEYYSLEDILRDASKKVNPLIVMLDEINDPHNLGAILRSCDAFGASGVIIKKRNQVGLDSTVAKTSAGAINFVKVAQVTNLVSTIKLLKERGYWVVSTAGEGNANFQDITYDFPCVLVVGNEGKGISRLVLENSDYIVKIPMVGEINSLNASVATAVVMSYIQMTKNEFSK